MSVPEVWLLPAVVLGHVSWLLWAGNLIHATPWDHRLIKLFAYAVNAAIFFGAGLQLLRWGLTVVDVQPAYVAALRAPAPPWLSYYFAACAINALFGTLPWLVRRLLLLRDPAELLATERRVVDLRDTLGNPPDLQLRARTLTAIPGNETLTVELTEKRVHPPRLPVELDGLRIVHLTDVHMTGRIGRAFFERAFELAAEARPDLVLLTGDLIEKEACWDWIPTTFGRLQPRYGTYFVLGNHDIRIDHRETQRRLCAAGLIDVGGRVERREIRGVEVLLAGNELPWIAPAADMTRVPPRGAERQLRILLAHSPDQYAWARRHDFDLAVAGHVHGGQIQIPPLGPVLAPSYHGVHYACGTFYRPPTLLHVGRGLSSKLPLRFFCRPELTTLILTATPRDGVAGVAAPK